MSALETPQSFGYQQTLMYGQYSKDLAAETKKEVERLRKLREEERERAEKAERERALPETPPPSPDFAKGSPGFAKVVARLAAWLRAARNFLFAHVVSEDWFFLLLLGLIMALIAFAIDWAVAMCHYAHKWLFLELNFSPALQFVSWVLFTIVFILFSTGFVHIVSPNAIGSGIPEMKTILRGVILKEYLSFRTAVSKVVGLVAALGSGLPFGKEGPFVHISSIVATLLGKLARSKGLYENESRQTEMLAAACAVGVACSFAAPIGGVLFSIEVTSTLFAVSNYWRGFFAAVCSALMFRILDVLLGQEQTITALFRTNFSLDFAYHPLEILAYVGLGVLCGFGGALFVNCHRRFVLLIRGQRTLNKFLQRNRFIYPFLVALLVSSMSCPVSLGRYMAGGLTQKSAVQQLFSNFTWTGPRSNPNVYEEAILNNWRQGTDTKEVYITLVVFILMNFWMGVICITLPVPAGAFIPVFVLGAAKGRLVGEAMASWFPDGFHEKHFIIPGGYAVVGAAAFAGASTHTISTTVIVCELTGQINHILPLTFAVLIANFVAKKIETNIFDSIIRIKKLPYLPDITTGNSASFNVFVDDFMIKDIFYITYTSSTYREIKLLLDKTKLRAYPLVDSHQHMILLGSVQRAELELLLDREIGKERRALPPDEGWGGAGERGGGGAAGAGGSAGASPAMMRRNRSSNSLLDDIPNYGGLELVKEQLRAMAAYSRGWQFGGNSSPYSAHRTVHGLPSASAKPGKSILKHSQTFDDVKPKFFLGSGDDSAVPNRVRKSAAPQYNPYHTYSGPQSTEHPLGAAEKKPSFAAASSSAAPKDSKPKAQPLSSLFQPLSSASSPTDSPRGFKSSVTSLLRGFGRSSPAGSTGDVAAAAAAAAASRGLQAASSAPRRPRAVCELSEAEQRRWEERQLDKTVEYHGCVIDPAPFQLVAHTSLHKVHSLFALLALKQAYVTNIGRLVGVVSLLELRQCIEGTLSGKVVPKSVATGDGGESETVLVEDMDEEEEEDEEEGGIDLGPSKFEYGHDKVLDVDQQRQINSEKTRRKTEEMEERGKRMKEEDDEFPRGEVATRPASPPIIPGVAEDKNAAAARLSPPASPMPKLKLEPLPSGATKASIGAEEKLASIFDRFALPSIPSAEKGATEEKGAAFAAPVVTVTPVTPTTPSESIADPLTAPTPLKPTHEPSRVQGSRFRRFVVDESKLSGGGGENDGGGEKGGVERTSSDADNDAVETSKV